MKISVVGACGLEDGYLGAANALRRKGVEVDFIPAMLYKMQDQKNHVQNIINDLKQQNSDIVLWWRSETLTPHQLKHIRENVNGKFVLICWDAMHVWEKANSFLDAKCKMGLFEKAFTCCKDSVEEFKKRGCESFYVPSGFDQEVHYYCYDDEYACDISLVCTNLYHGNSISDAPHISRKQMLEHIIEKGQDIDLRIYGPENFKGLFGEYYRGWINFKESKKVFSSSKINICTHLRPDANMYTNERVSQILGCSGLLYMEHINGIEEVLIPGEDFVVIDCDNIMGQIKDILNNYDDYQIVKENGYKKGMQFFQWSRWADIVYWNL